MHWLVLVSFWVFTSAPVLAQGASLDSTKQALPAVKALSLDYKNQAQETTNGLNAFALTEKNHRERYHDLVLSGILNYSEKNDVKQLLGSFLNYLNSAYPSAPPLNVGKFDLSNTEVRVEIDRIDLSIRDEDNRQAIIIENKINNAPDQDRQLPRYVDELKAQNYEVVGVVYLVKDLQKTPDTSTWEAGDVEKVLPLLRILPIYDPLGKACLYEWLGSSLAVVDDINSLTTLKQYSQFIKKLGDDQDNKNTDQFIQLLLEGDNLEVAIRIQEMMVDLRSNMLKRIEKRLLQLSEDNKMGDNVDKDKIVFGNYKFEVKLESLRAYTVIFLHDGNDKKEVYNALIDSFIAQVGLEDQFDSVYKKWRNAPAKIIPISGSLQESEDRLFAFLEPLLVKTWTYLKDR